MNLENKDTRNNERNTHAAPAAAGRAAKAGTTRQNSQGVPSASRTRARVADQNANAPHPQRAQGVQRQGAMQDARASGQKGTAQRQIKPASMTRTDGRAARQGAVRKEGELRLTPQERERLLREERRRRSIERAAKVRYILSVLSLFAIVFVIFALLFVGVFFISLTSHKSPDERAYTLVLSDYENKLEVEDGSVVDENGIRYVNFSRIAEFYGFAMVGSINDMKYVVKESENETVSFAPGSDKAYVNDVALRTDGAAFYENGDLYVSESFVEQYILGFELETDASTRTLSVKRKMLNALDAEGKIADGKAPNYESIAFMLKAPAVTSSIAENDSAVVMPTFEFNSELSAYEEYMNPGSTTEFLTLVNSSNKLGEDYIPTGLSLLAYGDGMYLKQYAARSFEAMMKEANACGVTGLTVSQAYVSYADATRIYNEVVDKYVDLLGSEQAKRYAAATVALPGTDEHQTGLAVDLALSSGVEITTSTAFAWLCDNSYKFGFILRYPIDKSDVTGHVYKPGQFRYVGRYHAVRMNALGLTLDEYAEYLGL